MGFVVGQQIKQITLRRVLSPRAFLLRHDGEGPQADTAKVALCTSTKGLLPTIVGDRIGNQL